MPASDRSRVLRLTRRRGGLTAADARHAGIHSQQLTRLVADGVLVRVARGQYRLANARITEHHGLALAARAVPDGVICLLSALTYHGIGTHVPPDIWMAIPYRRRTPALVYPPLRVVRFSGEAFTTGIERYRAEGSTIRVYSVAKTLADLFKHRNKIGIDVAVESLTEAWRYRRFTMDALARAAKVCRVERVMRPYLEAIVW